MLRLALVRHAQTAPSLDGRYCGSSDVALNQAGRELAERLGERLAASTWQAIYASPLVRSGQTAEPLSRRLGLPIQRDAGLAELRYGDWELKTPADIERSDDSERYALWLKDPVRHAPPGGETAQQLAERALAAVTRVRARHARGAVVAFSHKTTIRVLLCALLGIDISSYRLRIAQPVGSVSVIAFHDSGPRLTRLTGLEPWTDLTD